MTPPQVNTAFELLGSALALHGVWLASRTKPQGVSVPMFALNVLWASQCVFYYLSHGEHVAAVCAAVRSCCALVWCYFALRK